jgi:4-hydroxy-2-oxoheptanedioate aldolase
MRALDAGAQGVIVPLIENPETAKAIVSACRFPPEGTRSWGSPRPPMGVLDIDLGRANREVVCLAMVETAEGMANLDAIASVEGLDGIYVGPSDLALSHGMHPLEGRADTRHRDLVQKILEACRRHGLVAGIQCHDIEYAAQWLKVGFQMVSVGSDAGFVGAAAREVVIALRPTNPQFRL